MAAVLRRHQFAHLTPHATRGRLRDIAAMKGVAERISEQVLRERPAHKCAHARTPWPQCRVDARALHAA
eukprot:4768363-Lingulodinium_polyedra.AAC.1